MSNYKATQNYLVPADGTTHAVTTTIDLDSGPRLIEWQNFTLDNFPFIPQGAHVNTKNSGTVTFRIPGLEFEFEVLGGQNQWVTFPAPVDAQIMVSGSGNVIITWVNYPVIPTGAMIDSVSIVNPFIAVSDIVSADDGAQFNPDNYDKVFGYNIDGDLESIEITIGLTTYRKTIVYDAGNVVGITRWEVV
jgi:hypothetical protein